MDGMVREDHFVITVASEIMAILCLADDMADLKKRLGRIIVAYTFDGKPVTADDLQATGSMAALLTDALKPNLIQTLEHTPAIVHGGPFANIEMCIRDSSTPSSNSRLFMMPMFLMLMPLKAKRLASTAIPPASSAISVSYTHLDVYKRQYIQNTKLLR